MIEEESEHINGNTFYSIEQNTYNKRPVNEKAVSKIRCGYVQIFPIVGSSINGPQ